MNKLKNHLLAFSLLMSLWKPNMTFSIREKGLILTTLMTLVEKKSIKLGQVYLRSDLTKWSPSVDRYLKRFIADGTLQKVARGLYYYPAKASFGNVPPEDKVLVWAFLQGDDSLLISPNFYNSLGVGTTQLYNKCLVYNHKRHGRHTLAGKVFEFRKRQRFPRALSKEFLLVDLLNNLHDLAEDRDAVLQSVRSKMLREPRSKMRRVVNAYAGGRTKALLNRWISEFSYYHCANKISTR